MAPIIPNLTPDLEMSLWQLLDLLCLQLLKYVADLGLERRWLPMTLCFTERQRDK